MPLDENKKLLEIADRMKAAREEAIRQKKVYLFIADFDTASYGIGERPSREEPEISEEKEINFEEAGMILVSGRNSQESAISGRMSFSFYPDGTQEFGLLEVKDPSDNSVYTLFLNPYLSSVEILDGSVDFDEEYNM